MSKKKFSNGLLDFLLKQHKLKRVVNSPVFENIIKAEKLGCAAYEKAVLENKSTYIIIDGHDQFDNSVSSIEQETNWTEVIDNAELTKFALGLAGAYVGRWVCVTVQGNNIGEAHCIAMCIEKTNGKGMMKYFKIADKTSLDLDLYVPVPVPATETKEVEMKVETEPTVTRCKSGKIECTDDKQCHKCWGDAYQAKIDACKHDIDWTSNALKCKKNCGGDKWSY